MTKTQNKQKEDTKQKQKIYRCIRCSTAKKPVYTAGIPLRKIGMLVCEFCGGIDLEQQNKTDANSVKGNAKWK